MPPMDTGSEEFKTLLRTMPPAEVARRIGMRRTAVYYWLQKYGLKPVRGSGRSAMVDWQAPEVVAALQAHSAPKMREWLRGYLPKGAKIPSLRTIWLYQSRLKPTAEHGD